ncbi:hypothetical protein GOHSU_12_01410 [Gordonia hirsuta DSM 44140 = NBRC 16056]|uniref:Peptidase S51 family protein n=1 Tax=Gordonia hirsuta DSM 44140 = NBRC 16056 TaxID=1121927 RepID=L7L7L2_9ACTN|nr:Type 1 glutamine amidotransferase-like domain-containing protein [Gordonia hirsuta]GAC56751.1 hypothetical protein GOHSU_12_01410 [Gordonia hirsuta DSM 44140 = NBRC 16056]
MDLLLLSWGADALPEFLSRQVGKEPAETVVGVLDDASIPFGDRGFVVYERERLTGFGYRVRTLRARDFTDAAQFAAALDRLDAVYVCAGETFVLLESLDQHGLRRVLAQKVRAGLPYVGLSAGAVIAGPSAEPVSLMDDAALAPGLTDHRGLGLIDTVPIPHADGRIPGYPPALIDTVRRRYQDRYRLTFLDDDQALLVRGAAQRIVSSPDRLG